MAIDGFYNDVRPLFDWEREAAAALPITDADICGLAGVNELAGEPGFTAIERVGARPTAEVNGMGGGYQGEGTKDGSSAGSLCQADVPARSESTP